jgi:hypothetical protein
MCAIKKEKGYNQNPPIDKAETNGKRKNSFSFAGQRNKGFFHAL